jgi:hypothetical protein
MMTNTTPPDIEELLGRCLEAARSGGDPEELLRQHPEVAGEVRPLLALAAELEELPEPAPSMSAMMRTLARLATSTPAAGPARPRIRFFSRAVLARAAAVFLCVALLGWGTVAASSGALPGDMLYPVKLLTERAQFFLTVNTEARAELRIVFSGERLKEALRKHEGGGGIDKALLQSMLDEAQRALDAGPDIPEARRGLFFSRIAYLSDFQKNILEQLKGRVGPEEQQVLTPFIDACSQRCGRMCRMMGCGGRQGGASRPGWLCTCPTCE